MDEKQAQEQQAKDPVIKPGGAVETHPLRKLTARVNDEAVIGAVLLQAQKNEIHHLAERHRDHDEINAPGAQADRAGNQREDPAERQGQQQVQPAVVKIVVGRNADAVGADADIGRVAEANHAAVAENQIQADRGDTEDQRPAQQVEVKRLPDPFEKERRGRQQDQDQRIDAARDGRGQGDHLAPAGGNSPCGRNASTAAIRM